jgi:hypothetical protein
MPQVMFVPFTGLRVRAESLLELGMSLPGLRRRAEALARLPSLGLLTLAGMTPAAWTCGWREAEGDLGELVDLVASEHPDLVAVSALTASVNDAYRFCDAIRSRGLTVIVTLSVRGVVVRPFVNRPLTVIFVHAHAAPPGAKAIPASHSRQQFMGDPLRDPFGGRVRNRQQYAIAPRK